MLRLASYNALLNMCELHHIDNNMHILALPYFTMLNKFLDSDQDSNHAQNLVDCSCTANYHSRNFMNIHNVLSNPDDIKPTNKQTRAKIYPSWYSNI